MGMTYFKGTHKTDTEVDLLQGQIQMGMTYFKVTHKTDTEVDLLQGHIQDGHRWGRLTYFKVTHKIHTDGDDFKIGSFWMALFEHC